MPGYRGTYMGTCTQGVHTGCTHRGYTKGVYTGGGGGGGGVHTGCIQVDI